MKTFFWCDLQKMVFICFSASVERNFFQRFCLDIYGLCLDFQGFCANFQKLCPNFQGFCPDFRQIKTFGGTLAPMHPASYTTA